MGNLRATQNLVPTIVRVLAAILLTVSMAVQAADEDTSSSVYLVFDPDTGEFITSDDPAHALPSDTGLLDGPAPGIHDSATAANGGAGAAPLAVEPLAVEKRNSGIAAALGTLVIVVAGALFLLRRRRKSLGSDRTV